MIIEAFTRCKGSTKAREVESNWESPSRLPFLSFGLGTRLGYIREELSSKRAEQVEQ